MRIGIIAFALFSQERKGFCESIGLIELSLQRIKASGFHPLSLCVFYYLRRDYFMKRKCELAYLLFSKGSVPLLFRIFLI